MSSPPPPAPADLAAAIDAVAAGGEELRASTRRWFAENAERVSLEPLAARSRSRVYAARRARAVAGERLRARSRPS